MSLFSEKVDQNDEEDTDHFENIQSTNWYVIGIYFDGRSKNLSLGA